MATAYNNHIENLIPKSTRDREGLELITCKRQPGNLRITKYACALRYKKSLRMQEEIPDDEFGMIIKHGLERCRDCPRGKRYAEILLDQEGETCRAVRKRRGQTGMRFAGSHARTRVPKKTEAKKPKSASAPESQ
jgi:hypothetical protein